ncbi:MAG: sugar phosphate isomerase/epimerase [Candidatus Brockarchaeota archaeon]|nr:sugar phosphate isomerase/epimerase [Candidatus Brockarchaeota archaeon]
MKLGCNTVLFNKLGLFEALRHLSWAGYDGAELAFLGGMAKHVELRTDQPYVDEVASMARKLGLGLFAIEAGGTKDEIVKLFEVASRLGIPVVAVGSGGKSGDPQKTEQAFAYIRELAESAESWGITLAVKPHVGASVYNADTALQLVQKVDSPSLGINFDPSHLYRAGDDVAGAALKLGGRIVHSHFRDCPRRAEGPGLPEEQVPGRGKIDLLAVLRALKDAGYDGALDLEVIGAFQYPLSRQMAIAAEARGYLNRCLQELKLR